MAKLSTKESSKTHRCIIYGGPKTGKSLIAGKLAQYYKLIWIDMENGHEVLFQLPQEWQERIELIELRDTRSYPIAIETALKIVKGAVSICELHGKVGCMICKKAAAPFIDVDLNSLGPDTIVVWDSLTQLSNSAIANITKQRPDDYSMEFQDWGNLGKLLDIFLSHIQQASYNCIVISHETEAETDTGKTVIVPVGGTRNFSRNVAKYFDHVIYAEKKNKKHVFSSSSTYSTSVLTGSRSGVELESVEESSLLQIFKPELYASTYTKETSNTQATAGAAVVQPKSESTVSKSTSDILAKLKAGRKP